MGRRRVVSHLTSIVKPDDCSTAIGSFPSSTIAHASPGAGRLLLKVVLFSLGSRGDSGTRGLAQRGMLRSVVCRKDAFTLPLRVNDLGVQKKATGNPTRDGPTANLTRISSSGSTRPHASSGRNNCSHTVDGLPGRAAQPSTPPDRSASNQPQ